MIRKLLNIKFKIFMILISNLWIAGLGAAEVVIFEDNFNRPDSPDIGNGWTELPTTELISLVNAQAQLISVAQSPQISANIVELQRSINSAGLDERRSTFRAQIGLLDTNGDEPNTTTRSVRLAISKQKFLPDTCFLQYNVQTNELRLNYIILFITNTSSVSQLSTQYDLFNEPVNIELKATPEGYEGRLWGLTEPRPTTPQVTVSLAGTTDTHIKFNTVTIGSGNNPTFDLLNEVILVESFKFTLDVNTPTQITLFNQNDLTTVVGVFDADGLSDPANGVDFKSFELKINGHPTPIKQCIDLGICKLVFSPEGKSAALFINFNLSNFCVEASIFDFQGTQYTVDNKIP